MNPSVYARLTGAVPSDAAWRVHTWNVGEVATNVVRVDQRSLRGIAALDRIDSIADSLESIQEALTTKLPSNAKLGGVLDALESAGASLGRLSESGVRRSKFDGLMTNLNGSKSAIENALGQVGAERAGIIDDAREGVRAALEGVSALLPGRKGLSEINRNLEVMEGEAGTIRFFADFPGSLRDMYDSSIDVGTSSRTHAGELAGTYKKTLPRSIERYANNIQDRMQSALAAGRPLEESDFAYIEKQVDDTTIALGSAIATRLGIRT